jgi:hypothetical protein
LIMMSKRSPLPILLYDRFAPPEAALGRLLMSDLIWALEKSLCAAVKCFQLCRLGVRLKRALNRLIFIPNSGHGLATSNLTLVPSSDAKASTIC